MLNPTEKTRVLVWTQAGGRCAFVGCGRALVQTEGPGDASLVGQMAHIVAKSRQGPRGRDPLDDESRRDAANFVLLCMEHHKLVDDNPLQFPVPVLRRMKEEHEARFAPRNGNPVVPTLVEEELASTMLWVAALPQLLYSARCTVAGPGEVAAAVRRHGGPTPFWLNDGRIYAFHDLNDASGPFSSVIAPVSVAATEAEAAWNDPDESRRYVTLLNKAMTLHLNSRGLVFDPVHHRHHFVAVDGRERDVRYTTRAGAGQDLRIVRRERSKAGLEKDVWWHQAVRLRFERIGGRSWYLTIRPEFHLTLDGTTPMPPARIGRRVTRKKSTMYNRDYLNRVHFWRWFLCGEGAPRMVLDAGQPIVIDARLTEVKVRWPGVPADDAEVVPGSFEETLFTQQVLLNAVGNVANWEDLIA